MTFGRLLAQHKLVMRQDLFMYGVDFYKPQFSIIRPEITLVRRLRQAEFCRSLSQSNLMFAPLYYLARFRYQNLCNKYGATLPLGVFGPGLTLAHVGTVTINADARVGRNCRLHPGVTIGAVGNRAPLIGDDVFIGPNAVVVGGIEVGSRSHIGPCSVVSNDVGPDEIVVPVPAVIKARARPTWQERQGGSRPKG